MADTPFCCLSCRRPVDWVPAAGVVDGFSLDDSPEPHVCRECWSKLSVVERIETSRRWRLDRESKAALKAFVTLAESSGGGLFGFADRN